MGKLQPVQICNIQYTHLACSVISVWLILCIEQAADGSLVQESFEETMMGTYILKQRDANEKTENIDIVIESQIVLQDLDNAALAAAMLFGLIYVLNLNYSTELKYTFEVLQKVVMKLEGNALSKKAQALKNRLHQWAGFLAFQAIERDFL